MSGIKEGYGDSHRPNSGMFLFGAKNITGLGEIFLTYFDIHLMYVTV